MDSTQSPQPAVSRGLFLSVLLLAASVTSLAHAQLLYEHTNANLGTTRYYSDGNLHLAEFDVTEPIRIGAISGWFQNYDLDVAIYLFGYDPESGEHYGTFHTGHLNTPRLPNPPPPALTLPGRWATLEGLKWDLQPGHFVVGFENAGMPPSYSTTFTDAKTFTGFTNIMVFEDGSQEMGGIQGFGVRLYGAPLSAVPEPAVYGGMGGAMLVMVAMIRKRRAPTPSVVSLDCLSRVVST